MKISPTNAKPGNTADSVGSPTDDTGVVTGTVTATDPDGDNFTYSGPATTKKGAVTFDSATGTFTYTPTAAARTRRHRARASTHDQDRQLHRHHHDGHGGTGTVTVKVTIAPVPEPRPRCGLLWDRRHRCDHRRIAGTVYATDADGDGVTFTGSAATTQGAVVVNTDGAFTYTPTVPAREDAAAPAATLADKEDAFTVTAAEPTAARSPSPSPSPSFPTTPPRPHCWWAHHTTVSSSAAATGSTPTAIR